LTGTGWLTAWGTTYENGEASPGTLDRQHAIAIGSTAVDWCFAEVGSTNTARYPKEMFRPTLPIASLW
jgi:hypothetical protein